MANAYISLYEDLKNAGATRNGAIAVPLESILIEIDSEAGKQIKRASLSRGVSKGLFVDNQNSAAQKNREIVHAIATKLVDKKNTEDDDITADDVHFIAKKLSELFQTDRAYKFVYKSIRHILFDCASLHYSTRASSSIEPSSSALLLNPDLSYLNNQEWVQNLSEILKRKSIPEDLFHSSTKTVPELGGEIHSHVQWIFENIYCIPYPGHGKKSMDVGIPRYIHGIQHVSRVALYVTVFANLYRKHGDPEASQLSDEDIKLLQIAALFHDAAREDEGEDKWDHESALMLYFYLKNTLHVDKNKARLIAEATANKDPSPDNGYFKIREDKEGRISWYFEKNAKNLDKSKNIYQKLIHDADCLDIIRARPEFDALYLDFYQEIASKGNDSAIKEMAHLICEARSLIHIQGDAYRQTQSEIKKKYEHKDALSRIMEDIQPDIHPIIDQLGRSLLSNAAITQIELVESTLYSPENGLLEANMRAALREGQMIARSIAAPSAHTKKRAGETLAELEIRKSMRERMIATGSSKLNRHEKRGNPLRSASLLGYGSGIFANAGFLILNPDIDAISKISSVDINSGRGQKSHLASLKDRASKPSKEIIEKQLADLKKRLLLGGKASSFGHGAATSHSSHVELLYDIQHYDAIYYSNDPCLYNQDAYGKQNAAHPYSPILQAIYIQRQYALNYEKTRQEYIAQFGESAGTEQFIARFGDHSVLPIFEYSGIHNRIQRVPESMLTDEHIISMWQTMCTDFMKTELSKLDGHDIPNMEISDIMTLSMYKTMSNSYAKSNGPADANYPTDLRVRIHDALVASKKELMEQRKNEMRQQLLRPECNLLSDEVFFRLIRDGDLVTEFSAQIKGAIEAEMSSSQDLFLSDGRAILNFFNPVSLGFSVPPEYIYTAPVGLDNVNASTTNFIQKQIYFQTKAMRIFVLAKMIHHEGMIDAIKRHAEFLAKNALRMSEESIRGGIRMYGQDKLAELIHLKKFTEAFDLTSAEWQGYLNTLFDQLIASYISNYANNMDPGSIHELWIIITNCMKSGLLKAHQTDLLKNIFIVHQNNILNQTGIYRCADIRFFCLIAQLFKEDPTDSVKVWLSCTNERFNANSQGYLNDICSSISLDDEHLEVFSLILSKISRNESLLFYWEDDISYWYKMINDLQANVHKSTYSEAQLTLINTHWDEVCKEHMDNTFNRTHPVKYLTSIINVLNCVINPSLKLPLDSLVFAFNTTLSRITRMPIISNSNDQINSSTIDKILNLHAHLPGKEARQQAIEVLQARKIELQGTPVNYPSP